MLPLPAEVALGLRDHVDPQLSPDSRYITYLAPLDGVSNLWLLDLRDGTRRALTTYADFPIGGMFSYVSALGRSVWHRWTYDGRHVLHLRDRGGNEAFHVHAVDIHDGTGRDLTPYENIQAVIVGLSPDKPHHVAVQMGIEDPTRQDLHLIDISSGDTELVAANPGFTSWIVDRSLQLVGGVREHDDGSRVVEVRSDGGWHEVFRQPVEDGPLSAYGVDQAGRIVLLSSVGRDTGRLLLLDTADGSYVEPFTADPTYDVSGPVPHPRTGAIDMCRVSRDRTFTEGNADVEADLEFLRDHNPSGEALVVSRSLDDRTWLVEFSHDDGPLDYAVVERDTRDIRPVFSHLAALRNYRLARQEPFSFRSSDGLTIHGYRVAPPDTEGPLPTVVLVHGGPAQRQLWGWGDPYLPFAQWFATRGYLVLLVDYRGSNGYGTRFLRAINREWGGRSLSDLLEAVDYAAAQGWADPDRVAFWGASFGGYTALAAAAFAGDRIRCAVPIAGISNLLTMVESVPAYWKHLRRHWTEVLGDPATERDFLWSRSPLSRVDSITTPLLVVHGENDPRCRKSESDQLVEALRERGVDVDYLVLQDEGHVFVKPESWARTLAATERFLGQHMRTEPVGGLARIVV